MGCLGERVKLLLIVTTGVMECLGFAGLFAGWPSLVLVLKKEDYFADLCPSLRNSSDAEPRNGTDACVPQDDRFTLIFTIGYLVTNFAAVVNGLLLDYCGILASRLMGISLFTAGTLLIAFSTAASALLIFPAFALIGAGGIFLLTTNIKVGNLFGRKRATVITLFTGAGGSSAIIFLLVKVAFEAGLSLRAIFLFISCLSVLLLLRTVCLLPWKYIPYPLPEGFTYGVTCEKVGPMLMKVIAQRGNSTKPADPVEGDGDERGIIEVDARKGGGGEMWGREDENELTERDEGEGRGKTESGMETWRGETERDMSEGSRENEQVCSRETGRENEERGSERKWQNGECRGVTEGDKEYDSGETDGEGGTQKDRREEIKEENGEVSNGMEMVVVQYRTGGYPEARRGETEGKSDEVVEPERMSGAGHEQPTAGVDLQHNMAGGSQDNENEEEVPPFRSCVFSGLFFTTLFWFSVLQLRFSFFIGSLNLLLNLMTNGDSEQGPVTSQRKADMQTAVLSLAITVMLSVLLSVTAAIPVPEVQYLSFVMFVFNRAFLEGGLGAFLTITFPPCHFGKLYGIARALNAIVSLLQYPLSILVNGVLQNNPLYVNIGFIVLVALAFVHPINVYLYCRRADQQRRV